MAYRQKKLKDNGSVLNFDCYDFYGVWKMYLGGDDNV